MARPKAGSSRRSTDRRRVRTREALLSAGRTLFAARDVDGVSVDEIVEAAEVAKGSFYNHFTDKDVFAREIAAAVRRQVEQAVDAANAGIEDPAEHLARAMCVFARFALEHPHSARVLSRPTSGISGAGPESRGIPSPIRPPSITI